MALNLSSREISRRLANSTLTRADCAILRPLAQKTTLPINELVSPVPCHRVVVSSPVKGGNAQNQGEASAPLRGEVALNRGEAPLPCLRVNNSNEGSCEDKTAVVSPVSVGSIVSPPAYVRKKEFSLKCNILALCEAYPIGHQYLLCHNCLSPSLIDVANSYLRWNVDSFACRGLQKSTHF